MRVRRLLLMTLLLLALPATASAATETISGAGITATLSWHGRIPLVHGLRLRITSGGAVQYDRPIADSECGPLCAPADPTASMSIRDLAGDGRDELVVDLYSGGAHCCFIDQIFTPSGYGGWTMSRYDFENSGATLKDLDHDGRIEFVTADNRFAYEFADFVASGLPVQVLDWSGGRFIDVTRRYPGLIRRDARLWWGAYLQDHYPDRVGLIAAWVADEYHLGRSAQARSTLAREVARHHIGPRFVRSLLTFLRRHGY